MHVAIAIVGFRNVEDVRKCVAAIARSTYVDYEIVICENGGPAAAAALKSVLPDALDGGQQLRVVAAPSNLGYAGGVNLAIRTALDADAWWVLNPDTQIEPEAMEACVRRLRAGDCDAVGCTIVLPGGRVQSHGGIWQAALGRAVSIGYGGDAGRPVDAEAIEASQSYLNGACMLVSRRFVEAVGFMREDYFLYCEEVEWFLRGRARAMRLGYAPDARVVHEAGTTTGSGRAFREMPRMPVYMNERNRLLVTRDAHALLLPVVAVTALLVIFARFARRRAWRQVGYALAGWTAGLANRRGPPQWICTDHPQSA
ncbi:MAG: glycosyl transferase family 2 [Phenylobacterium sp. RIFCSPHIGHO2_01_FULL_69_31]|uniref:glycosyltransferase family 2 protein n=1 Tax=Phenylobacterium sp. RIFCSPHIGHO2_01_FULL_69_31 TaxID=1801944 RepID=UPI0008C23FB7|nr:glycosyltransferase family 2 protein [Phenylobacterium sp. RIFCSPHIGHO2_01_FULL_69_31]OHB26406.1 MAG: glycosyl transferase family 2 [Phenylobacterium sp. RIFCSPHIGHO2_01_FULL_69_31]